MKKEKHRRVGGSRKDEEGHHCSDHLKRSSRGIARDVTTVKKGGIWAGTANSQGSLSVATTVREITYKEPVLAGGSQVWGESSRWRAAEQL